MGKMRRRIQRSAARSVGYDVPDCASAFRADIPAFLFVCLSSSWAVDQTLARGYRVFAARSGVSCFGEPSATSASALARAALKINERGMCFRRVGF